MSQASLRCHICSWRCSETVFLPAGNFPRLTHPSYDEQESKIGSVRVWAPVLPGEGERMEALGSDSQMLQCPWTLLRLLGFLMFLHHPQPFLLPAEEI